MDHASDVLAAVRSYVDDDLGSYTDAIHLGFYAADPVFAKDRYAEFFFHCASTVPGWLAQVVVANATAESDGSAKLLSLWQSVNYNRRVEDEVLLHATDEARHSRLFIRLAGLAFPQWFDRSTLRSLQEPLTKVTKAIPKSEPISEDLLIDHLVQMNIGEIRTRIHMHLLAPVIHAFAPAENKREVEEILNGLVTDEVKHIGYTARLMELWCSDGNTKRIHDLYAQRLTEFHRITVEQTEASVRQYGQGLFPDLLEI